MNLYLSKKFIYMQIFISYFFDQILLKHHLMTHLNYECSYLNSNFGMKYRFSFHFLQINLSFSS